MSSRPLMMRNRRKIPYHISRQRSLDERALAGDLECAIGFHPGRQTNTLLSPIQLSASNSTQVPKFFIAVRLFVDDVPATAQTTELREQQGNAVSDGTTAHHERIG